MATDIARVKRAGEEIGPDPDFLIEDRVAMMIDDGSVPLFSRFGGFITIGEGRTTLTGVPETDEERTKYLPATRADPGDFETVRPESDLETLREAAARRCCDGAGVGTGRKPATRAGARK